MEHEIAVVVWNEFISKTNNKGIDFSFKHLETRISQIIEKTKTEICSKPMETEVQWKSTNYHGHVQEESWIKLENGKWYEIGFKNLFKGNFVHQGIKQFNDGFFDDGYFLKPFPTHAKEIILSEPLLLENGRN